MMCYGTSQEDYVFLSLSCVVNHLKTTTVYCYSSIIVIFALKQNLSEVRLLIQASSEYVKSFCWVEQNLFIKLASSSSYWRICKIVNN